MLVAASDESRVVTGGRIMRDDARITTDAPAVAVRVVSVRVAVVTAAAGSRKERPSRARRPRGRKRGITVVPAAWRVRPPPPTIRPLLAFRADGGVV